MSMEALLLRATLIFAMTSTAFSASHRTENFIVSAPNRALAKEIAVAAERFRHDLAAEWLGSALPRWPQPCPIKAHVQPNFGAGGQTSFSFRNRQPFGWDMIIQGSRERILDSVLPHEVTHTILATHFGRPLPRWADEGACTTVEHASERKKQDDWLIRFLHQDRGIPFNQMFRMTEYPTDIMPLYAQGYSVARYLIFQGGKQQFVRFVGDGLDSGDWNGSLRRNYNYQRIGDLQLAWEELLSEDILLRDVIDLEATFGNQIGDEESDEPVVAAPTAGEAPKQEAAQELDADGNPIQNDDDDDEDDAANMSLAAMEAALKPRVLETLEVIAHDFAELSEMQDARMSATLNEDSSFSEKAEDTYQTLRSQIVQDGGLASPAQQPDRGSD